MDRKRFEGCRTVEFPGHGNPYDAEADGRVEISMTISHIGIPGDAPPERLGSGTLTCRATCLGPAPLCRVTCQGSGTLMPSDFSLPFSSGSKSRAASSVAGFLPYRSEPMTHSVIYLLISMLYLALALSSPG